MAHLEPEPIAVTSDVDLGDGLSVGADGVIKKGRRIARPTDAPVRDDLPADHPLRGQRVLRNVPSGWPDAVISADGRMMPAVDLEE